MLKTALLVLTLTEGGATRVTLSTTDDPQSCEGLKAVVSSILADNNTSIIAARCGPTAIELTPFDHSAGPEDEIHRYKVMLLPDQNFLVIALGAREKCVVEQTEIGSVYCAISSQTPKDPFRFGRRPPR